MLGVGHTTSYVVVDMGWGLNNVTHVRGGTHHNLSDNKNHVRC